MAEGKKNRKIGTNKPFCARYALELRESKNKRRNVATAERRQAKDAKLRPRRELLRCIGSLERIDRRIRMTSGIKALRTERARLQGIRIKVQDAVQRAAVAA